MRIVLTEKGLAATEHVARALKEKRQAEWLRLPDEKQQDRRNQDHE